MSHLLELQTWLRGTDLEGVVVPSTDEFLSEFAPPANRRLRWVTGFRGSTGVAVVLRSRAALFVDGRYFVQAAADLGTSDIAMQPSTLDARSAWLKQSLGRGGRLGIDPWLHSIPDMMQWRELAATAQADIEMLADNPIDELWSDRPAQHRPLIVDYPVRYAGESHVSKCAAIAEHLRATDLHALLIADPEDVSWLLNVRASDNTLRIEVGDWHVVPSCPSRALVYRDGKVTWFVDYECLAEEVAARHDEWLTMAAPGTIVAALGDVGSKGRLAANLARTPASLEAAANAAGRVRADDSVARRRWRKHPVEVQSARRAHVVDAVAVVRFISWLKRTVLERPVSEIEAAQALEAFRSEHPQYKGASMPLMSASGVSGAQPHYVPDLRRSRTINSHPIFWMDSGGQYAGGSTDNTATVAVGAPEPKHVHAHTLILKCFIALATARFPVGTYGVQLDTIARQPLWCEGMNYAHGTGHGVGNCLNIHEGPFIGREPGPASTMPFEPDMIVTNEPGYYVADDFGMRIESHMVVVASRYEDFLEFETISRLPIDPELVDFALLSRAERNWLAEYHRTVRTDLMQLLDPTAATLLESWVQRFERAQRDAPGQGYPLEGG
jgi:Xaa-Pro aminopeptidase